MVPVILECALQVNFFRKLPLSLGMKLRAEWQRGKGNRLSNDRYAGHDFRTFLPPETFLDTIETTSRSQNFFSVVKVQRETIAQRAGRVQLKGKHLSIYLIKKCTHNFLEIISNSHFSLNLFLLSSILVNSNNHLINEFSFKGLVHNWRDFIYIFLVHSWYNKGW